MDPNKNKGGAAQPNVNNPSQSKRGNETKGNEPGQSGIRGGNESRTGGGEPRPNARPDGSLDRETDNSRKENFGGPNSTTANRGSKQEKGSQGQGGHERGDQRKDRKPSDPDLNESDE